MQNINSFEGTKIFPMNRNKLQLRLDPITKMVKNGEKQKFLLHILSRQSLILQIINNQLYKDIDSSRPSIKEYNC